MNNDADDDDDDDDDADAADDDDVRDVISSLLIVCPAVITGIWSCVSAVHSREKSVHVRVLYNCM